MAIALFTLMAFIVATATSTLMASADIVATREARGASQVHFVAESGIAEALQRVNGPGVVNFQNDVVGQWATTWGSTAPRGFGPVSGYTYTVTPVASATDPSNAGQLIATANGRESVHNVVVANVVRSDIPSTAPGAIYLANNQPTSTTFKGDAFSVDGNDHNYTGGAGPAPPVPGLSTRNDANTQEAIASLTDQEKDNIRGLGFSFSPLTPSIMTSPAAPSIAEMDQIIDDLLARPGVVPYGDNQINGNATFGTTATPQITHFTNTGGVTIKANGNSSGAGIMIVEGDLTIQGDLNFKGLILVRGKTSVQVTDVIGNATVYGSLWTQDIDLVVGGSAIVDYSTQALALANQVAGGHALPSPLKVISMADCGMMPSGVGGCP